MNWEYKVLDWWQNEKDLNEMGKQGWELAAVRTRLDGHAIFYFKRPISEPAKSKDPNK